MSDTLTLSARLLQRRTIAQDTVAFEIERPPGFEFEAGQFVSVQLQDFEAPEDGSDDGERMLSIASAPHDARLTVAVRMRDSAFKRHLAQAAVGEQGIALELSPAMGDLVLPAGSLHPVVMIAGGIGITPFYSMIRDLQHRQARGEAVPQVTLLYGNRHREAATWYDELNAIATEAGFLRVVHVLADEATPSADHGAWASRPGLIDAGLIREQVPDPVAPNYYVVGPTAMVAAMQDALDECGIDPGQVFIEFFAGY